MKIKAELGVIQPQVKELLESPGGVKDEERFSPGASGHLDLRVPVSRIVSEHISVLSHPVCGHF